MRMSNENMNTNANTNLNMNTNIDTDTFFVTFTTSSGTSGLRGAPALALAGVHGPARGRTSF